MRLFTEHKKLDKISSRAFHFNCNDDVLHDINSFQKPIQIKAHKNRYCYPFDLALTNIERTDTAFDVQRSKFLRKICKPCLMPKQTHRILILFSVGISKTIYISRNRSFF